jgi:hypothetical protein
MTDLEENHIFDEIQTKLDLLYDEGIYEFEFMHMVCTCIEEDNIITCYVSFGHCQDFTHTVEPRDYEDYIDCEVADMLTDIFKRAPWRLKKHNNKRVKVIFHEEDWEYDDYVYQLKQNSKFYGV